MLGEELDYITRERYAFQVKVTPMRELEISVGALGKRLQAMTKAELLASGKQCTILYMRLRTMATQADNIGVFNSI
jgi:hypothetical protein